MGVRNGKKTPSEIYSCRLDALRDEMQRHSVDGFIIPVADEYQGEYPPESARRVAWLTGFTGSAGVVVVLRADAANTKAAAIFVDGRYTLQAQQQVDMIRYEQKDLMADSIAEWVASQMEADSTLAYDPWLHTQSAIEAMHKTLAKSQIRLVAVAHNLVDAIWDDRPAVPCAPVRVYGEHYAGESSASKRERVGAIVAKNEADVVLLTAPDAIAWLLNIRGGDVSHTPLALSFALLHRDATVDWFIDGSKISAAVHNHIGSHVRIFPMESLQAAMQQLGQKKARVQFDSKRSAAWFHQQLHGAGAMVIEKDDPCLLPKACKNDVEIEGMRQAHIRDGVALTTFLAWLDNEVEKRDVTELEAEAKLLQLRQLQANFQEPSFDTIAGSGAHGAIIHYRATAQSNKVLERNSLFLLDSGGQYLDGTTDVTRTIAIGTPSEEQKRRFTQVLKGHISLASIVFPKGVCGRNLDVLARAALWADGEDYAHGTGHGVGAYLGVHEGPQGIHMRSDVPLQPGMVISNEPGYYKEGEFGIRIESLIVVREQKGGHRPFYAFETITLAPIDKRLIELSMLTPPEREWLDSYHQRVYATLAPLLDDTTRAWLETMIRL